MASVRGFFDQAIVRAKHASKPFATWWNSIAPRHRSLAIYGALLLMAALTLTFVLLPALEQRRTLAGRLPVLEGQLSKMRSQSKEVAVLASAPANPVVARTFADIAALQSIFGPGAQITAAEDGFRIVIASITYESWWDKTSDAISAHTLALREATLTRTNDSSAGPSGVAVDMRLGSPAKVAGPSAPGMAGRDK